MASRKTPERNTAIDYINRDIVNVKEDLQVLSKIVRDGNGHPSLMQQVATLQNDINHLKTEMESRLQEQRDLISTHFDDLHNAFNDCSLRHNDKLKLHWHFQTAIWVALIGSITSIILHFFK